MHILTKLHTNKGEIAAKLTIVATLLITLGLITGINTKRLGRATTYAAGTCEYTFGKPTLTQLEGRLICTVPTSTENVPTIGCSLARNETWAAESKLLGPDGTSMRFELTLEPGNTSGTYDLIAYEFDQFCSHPDQVVQVFVDDAVFLPTPTSTPRATPTPEPTATPTPVPACLTETTGECMSQALCLAGATNQNLGDLGCSAIRSDWICCQDSSSNAPTKALVPTSTSVPPTPEISPTPTPIPSPTAAPRQVQTAAENVGITATETCGDIEIVANNRQSWAYKIGTDQQYEVVPVLGATDKQQVVDATCE